MARPSVEPEIDRLYQLPVSEFTRERNEAAKRIGGEEGKRIRALPKPSVSAWGVNQLYWRDRPAYDALVEAAQRLRTAHRAVLGGRKADLRDADAAHRDAMKAALASTLRVLSESGQAVSAATETEIVRTLESLPVQEAPGRLAKPLRPGGFEALQGMPVRARAPEAEKERNAAPKAMSAREDEAARRRVREQAERAVEAARREEQRARAALAAEQKRLKAAEKKAAGARAAWERAREEEIETRDALRRAEEALERRARELRRAEESV